MRRVSAPHDSQEGQEGPPLLAAVRSVRVGRRVIQQTVAHLGELDEQGRVQARALARRLVGAPEQAQLFNDGSEQLMVPVRLKGIRIERSVSLAMCTLRLRCGAGRGLRICAIGCCRSERSASRGRRWRLCWWQRGSASHRASCTSPKTGTGARRFQICCNSEDEEVNKDRLYRGLDHLLAHKVNLEAHLSKRCGELFAVQNEVLLYDVTSTYFEGQAEANPQAQRGYSRDHRPDCKQVCIALVVTFDDGEPADRPHPAAKPACRRPLRNRGWRRTAARQVST